MLVCSNDNCKKEIDPEWDQGIVWIGYDGDAVCNAVCKKAYEQQRDHFFEYVLTDDAKFVTWMGISE